MPKLKTEYCEGWPLEDPEDHATWIIEYLGKRGIFEQRHSYESIAELATRMLRSIGSQPGSEGLFIRMENAWRARERRRKNNKKVYNFEMPKSLDAILTNLSKKRGEPRDKVVQALLENAAAVAKHLQEESDKELIQLKEKLQYKIDRVSPDTTQKLSGMVEIGKNKKEIDRLNNELKKLKGEFAEYKSHAESWLLGYMQHKHFLEKKGLKYVPDPDSAEDEMKRFEKALKSTEDQIKIKAKSSSYHD